MDARSRQQLTLREQGSHAIPLDLGGDAKSGFDALTADPVRTPDDNQLLLNALALRDLP